MADQREGGISWCDETWNVVRGCTRVSEGCRFCYAEKLAATRLSGPGRPYDGLAEMTPAGPRWTGKVVLVDSLLDQPLRWKRPRRIFVNAMSDLFHEGLTDRQIAKVVAVMFLAKWHTFQVLTKRVERMRALLTSEMFRWIVQEEITNMGWPNGAKIHSAEYWPLRNVWWGASAENQDALDKRAKDLLACRADAAVLWLSLEPLIGGITLTNALGGTLNVLDGMDFEDIGDIRDRGIFPKVDGRPGVDLVVVGGESGPGARPMFPAWARALRDECKGTKTLYHHKQNGEWGEVLDFRTGRNGVPPKPMAEIPGEVIHLGGDSWLMRLGKKVTGRSLDGVEHNDLPGKPAEIRG